MPAAHPLTDPSLTDLNALLIVTPHSSGALPADILREMLGNDVFDTPRREAFLREIFMDGDPYTDLIYAVPGARLVSAPWSRFAADLNRERGDQVDNGVIKLMNFDRQPLYPPAYRLTEQKREERLSRLWDPFDQAVERGLRGAKLMIVGHCMAPQGPKLGGDTGAPRPAICLMLGSESASSFPREKWDALQSACEDAFAGVIAASPYREVIIGVPWSTDTLSTAHHARSGVPAFGIEFNSGLYLQGNQALDGALLALNRAFEDFARQALELVAAP